MKNRIAIIYALFISIVLGAQEAKVWQGDVHAKDFDTFQQGGFTKIKGSLRVYDSSVKDLAPLQALTEITGDLYIGIYDYKKDLKAGNKLITTLNGLQNLRKVSGEIEIRQNKLLEDISALKGLKSARQLNIAYNPMLKSLAGLENISGKIPDGVQLYKNKRLQDITALSGITAVGDHLAVNSNLSLLSLEGLHNIKAVEKGYLAVRSNNYLKNLKGLRSIKRVDEEVQITTNPVLKNLKGLEKLTAVGKFFSIKENDALESLEGLKSLKSIAKDFKIYKNSQLKNLNGIKKLTTIKGYLDVQENPVLTDVSGLNTLKDTIGGSIFFIKNKSLKKITGLNTITHVKKAVVLSRNHLETISGFNNLKSIGGNLSFTCNYSPEITGFKNLITTKSLGIGSDIPVLDLSESLPKLTQIQKGVYMYSNEALQHFKGPNSVLEIGEIKIKENKRLVSISGFNGLKKITGRFALDDNRLLETIYGFNSLETIHEIRIDDHPTLESITGFESLKHIGDLWMDENRDVKDLSGFNNLSSVDDLYLRDNDSLQDLSGFKNLQKVTKELDIHNHNNLRSLKGLEKLSSVGKILDITYNSRLKDYSALQEGLLQSKTDREIQIYKNAYNPSKNGLLIHDKLATKIIPESYLQSKKNRWSLALLRNEIFARRGFVFGKKDLAEYFSKKGWYTPIEGVEIVLNDIEEENVRLLKKYEQVHIDFAINAVKKIKERYEQSSDVASNYRKYHSRVKKFITTINTNKLVKSNTLVLTKNYSFNKPQAPETREEELDHISIHFDTNEEEVRISIHDKTMREDDYDAWLEYKIINFDFSLKHNKTTLIRAFQEND